MSEYDWQQRPIGSLKGVGKVMADKLARLNLTTAGELIRHFPRRYDDYSQIITIRNMRPGNVTFRGTIERVAGRYARARKLHITEAIITDGTGTVKAIWFNQAYLAKSIPTGTPVLVSGELKFKANDLALQAPAIDVVDDGLTGRNTGRIVPVYPQTEGLSSRQLRALIEPLLPLAAALEDPLPKEVVERAHLIPYAQAIQEIHFPTSAVGLASARHRLAFEELWYLILASLVIKHEIKTENAPLVTFKVEAVKALLDELPFEATPDQKRAAWEIFQDLGREQPMNRLLEGDVGSGKTLVATMAIVMAMASGYQTALMVPTEILARQHIKSMTPLLERLGYDAVALLGKQSAADKKATTARIATGTPVLVIGTQALLAGKVDFPNLALVIVDEQHRFGVAQRQALKQKSGRLPHLLSMTATPIPRSLQLTVYGDLDLSIIEHVPPGRIPITTKAFEPKDRETVYRLINTELDAGRQAFVVCSLIDPNEQIMARSAVAEYDRLKKGPFKNRRIGLVHGKLTADEKAEVMGQFAAGELDVLVATTVIEVGIDVPNASVMLIEGAERFGLAALHQLRGRVGRGMHAGYCYLMPESKTPGTLERIKALEKTSDGFRLAQIDLEQRGPGQIYGLRQHGTLDLQLADISDAKLLAEVRSSAQSFLESPDGLRNHPLIATRVNSLKAVTSLD
jgi:ATP-dependent DNA helicase RecG